MASFQSEKTLIRRYFSALSDANSMNIVNVISDFTAEDYTWFGVYPFEKQNTAENVANVFWRPFLNSWTSVQRREDIFMAGKSEVDDSIWVTSMGHFMGLLDHSWLGIPATGKVTFLRYAEFHNVKNGKIVRSGFFCDIIGVMHQCGINPLPLQTGSSLICPGPITHDGLQFDVKDVTESKKTIQLLGKMIADLDVLNKTGEDDCPPEYLAQSWSENMIWYGPAGIGASYTIPRYQQQHQYPFRKGLKDKIYNGHVCRYAEGNYACFFGWPNLTHTPIGGFLGLPGNTARVDMRVVDVYRREGNKLVENWVLMDLPWWLKQQGLDILNRTESIINT